MRGACRILIGKPDGEILLGGPVHEWEGCIKMDEGWIHVTQDRPH
jgi:hypothetical protein